jgi:hypothetical protein
MISPGGHKCDCPHSTTECRRPRHEKPSVAQMGDASPPGPCEDGEPITVRRIFATAWSVECDAARLSEAAQVTDAYGSRDARQPLSVSENDCAHRLATKAMPVALRNTARLIIAARRSALTHRTALRGALARLPAALRQRMRHCQGGRPNEEAGTAPRIRSCLEGECGTGRARQGSAPSS